MSSSHRVIWSQGMFLQPHHFQQQTRFIEALLDARVAALGPHFHGFAELVLDEALLATGQVALQRGRGVLPDGTGFSMPDVDGLPPPLSIAADMHNELVVLAVPRARAGNTEVDFGEGKPDPLARYVVREQDLRDQSHAADEPEPVQLGLPTLRLLRLRDATEAFSVLGVVRVLERRADNQVVLDRAYLPPQTRIDATGQLSTLASLLHGLVRQRAQALAGMRGESLQGVSDVFEFLMLQLLNRHDPLLRQMAGAPSAHPQALHALLSGLAGELATFSRADGHAPEYPLYRHDDLQGSFAPLMEDLRDYLSAAVQRRAVPIELVARPHGVRTAVVDDAELLHNARFVLAVRADLPPDYIQARFPAQGKLGPVDRIKDLVNLQLPGLPLRWLPVVPRQLPFHDGSHYFELDRTNELWKQIERSRNLFVHVTGDFPGLELELWALRAS